MADLSAGQVAAAGPPAALDWVGELVGEVVPDNNTVTIIHVSVVLPSTNTNTNQFE
jgi:hypothetical protein